MQRTLYSGLLSIADVIFGSQLILHPTIGLSIADTSNIRLLLQEIHFPSDNVLQFRSSFLRYLLSYFLASLMAFSGPSKFRNCKSVGISSPYSSLWLMFIPVAKMSKAQQDRDRNMDTIMVISVVHGQPLLLYSENQYEPKKNHSCSLCQLSLSRITNALQPVASK